jgi:hypothetical protein
MTNIIYRKDPNDQSIKSTNGTHKNQIKNINIKSAIHNNKRKFEPVTRRQSTRGTYKNQTKKHKYKISDTQQ